MYLALMPFSLKYSAMSLALLFSPAAEGVVEELIALDGQCRKGFDVGRDVGS